MTKKKLSNKPSVSIIILTYKNGLTHLKKCLLSLNKVSFDNYEIIVVDNNSSDSTVGFMKKNYPNVKLIENKKNLGFCEGNNQALEASSGKYVLLLNNDTEVEPSFLGILVDYLEKNPKSAVVQPKIKQLKNKEKLDACASFLTSTGFLYHYGYSQNEKDPRYNKMINIYSAKGACMLIRKKVIDKIGFFDSDYFAYFEETDFCHRVWLSGFSVNYLPNAEIYHLGGSGGKIDSINEFHSYKNRIQTYMKNFDLKSLISILPLHILLCLLLAIVYFLRFKPERGAVILRAISWNFLHIKLVLTKRKKIQKLRKIKDSSLMQVIKKSAGIKYYLHFFLNPRGKYDFERID